MLEAADDEADRAALVRRSLDLIRPQFEERTWQAFWRTAVDGWPAREVPEELGTTPGAVRVAKARVLRRLREEFEELIT